MSIFESLYRALNEAIEFETEVKRREERRMIDVGKQLQDAYDEGYKQRDAEIVRCEDCRHANECRKSVQYTRYAPNTVTIEYSPITWCSKGERRE